MVDSAVQHAASCVASVALAFAERDVCSVFYGSVRLAGETLWSVLSLLHWA